MGPCAALLSYVGIYFNDFIVIFQGWEAVCSHLFHTIHCVLYPKNSGNKLHQDQNSIKKIFHGNNAWTM